MKDKTEAQQDFYAARSSWSIERTGSYGESFALKRMSEASLNRTEEVRAELAAMISALRDEMATRFNALADEVDAIGADAVAEKKDGNAPEREPLDPVILGIAQAYRSVDPEQPSGNLRSFLRVAYRERVGKRDMQVSDTVKALTTYGLDADA